MRNPMRKILLLLVLLSTPLVSQSQTMKCADIDIQVSAGVNQATVTCLDGGGLPPVTPLPAVCPSPLFYVTVSGWSRTDAQSTRFSYDPSEAIASMTVDPSAGKATFIALRDPACKVTVSK